MKMYLKKMTPLFLVIILAQGWGDAYGQNVQALSFETKIVYEIAYVRDSTNVESISNSSALLLYNDSISLFEGMETSRWDSVHYLVFDSNEKKRLMSQLSYNSDFVYKIIKDKGRITTYDLLYGDINDSRGIGFYYNEPIPEWSLLSDTMTISGFVCQKATTELGGRHWTAWFAPEIPIEDGPYKFAGLPGLIIQVYDRQKYWVFNFKEIVRGNFVSTLEGQEGYQSIRSKKMFLEAKRKYLANVFEMQEQRTGRVFSPETRAIVKERLEQNVRNDNNWIELTP